MVQDDLLRRQQEELRRIEQERLTEERQKQILAERGAEIARQVEIKDSGLDPEVMKLAVEAIAAKIAEDSLKFENFNTDRVLDDLTLRDVQKGIDVASELDAANRQKDTNEQAAQPAPEASAPQNDFTPQWQAQAADREHLQAGRYDELKVPPDDNTPPHDAQAPDTPPPPEPPHEPTTQTLNALKAEQAAAPMSEPETGLMADFVKESAPAPTEEKAREIEPSRIQAGEGDSAGNDGLLSDFVTQETHEKVAAERAEKLIQQQFQAAAHKITM